MSLTIRIAVAARTSLYLPLYLALDENFYDHLPDDIAVELWSPDKDSQVHEWDGNLDKWVHDRVVENQIGCERPILFGLCDPYECFEKNTSRVVAAIVTKAAFWGFDANTPIATLSDAVKFDTIISFEKGMTAYLMFDLLQREAKKDFKHVGVGAGEDVLDKLQTEPSKSLAITPDLYQCQRLADAGKGFSIKYSFASHPVYADYFTTALIGREDVVVRRAFPGLEGRSTPLAQGLINGIQEAMIRLHTNPDCGVETLLRYMENDPQDPANRARASKVIETLVSDGIFPLDVTVKRSMWAKTLTHRLAVEEPDRKLSESKITESMESDVYDVFAHNAFQALVLTRLKGAPFDALGVSWSNAQEVVQELRRRLSRAKVAEVTRELMRTRLPETESQTEIVRLIGDLKDSKWRAGFIETLRKEFPDSAETLGGGWRRALVLGFAVTVLLVGYYVLLGYLKRDTNPEIIVVGYVFASVFLINAVAESRHIRWRVLQRTYAAIGGLSVVIGFIVWVVTDRAQTFESTWQEVIQSDPLIWLAAVVMLAGCFCFPIVRLVFRHISVEPRDAE